MPWGRWIDRLKFRQVVFLLSFIGILSYANAIFHPFVHDDIVFIRDNPLIGRWDSLPSIFTQPTSAHPLDIITHYYRPVLEIVYRAQYALFGANAAGYHFVNILLHIANGILIYALLLLLFKDSFLSFGTAVLFLIHPVQSEAVACIAGISNLLFSFFCLASFVLYLMAGEKRRGRRRVFLYIASLVFYLAGLFTKEQAVVLPFLIILYEVYLKGEAVKKLKDFLPLAGFFILTAVFLLWRAALIRFSPAAIDLTSPELWLRIAAIPQTLLSYFRALVFPLDLHYYRCVDILKPFLWPAAVLACFTAGAAFFISYLPMHKRRIILFGCAWFFITILPTLNIVPLIVEYSFIMASEHFLYLSAVGFFLSGVVIVGFLYRRVSLQAKGKIVAPLCLLIVFTLILMTMKQNHYWRGEIPLFERTLAFERNLGRVRILLARAYYFNKETDKAIGEYQKALDIMTGYAGKVKDPKALKFYLGFVKEIHFDLAHCHENKNEFVAAIGEYEKALAMDAKDAAIYNNLGTVYLRLDRLSEAADAFRRALIVDPRDVRSLNNLAFCLIKEGKTKDARELFEKALEIDPQFAPARQNLMRLLLEEKPL